MLVFERYKIMYFLYVDDILPANFESNLPNMLNVVTLWWTLANSKIRAK